MALPGARCASSLPRSGALLPCAWPRAHHAFPPRSPAALRSPFTVSVGHAGVSLRSALTTRPPPARRVPRTHPQARAAAAVRGGGCPRLLTPPASPFLEQPPSSGCPCRETPHSPHALASAAGGPSGRPMLICAWLSGRRSRLHARWGCSSREAGLCPRASLAPATWPRGREKLFWAFLTGPGTLGSRKLWLVSVAWPVRPVCPLRGRGHQCQGWEVPFLGPEPGQAVQTCALPAAASSPLPFPLRHGLAQGPGCLATSGRLEPRKTASHGEGGLADSTDRQRCVNVCVFWRSVSQMGKKLF